MRSIPKIAQREIDEVDYLISLHYAGDECVDFIDDEPVCVSVDSIAASQQEPNASNVHLGDESAQVDSGASAAAATVVLAAANDRNSRIDQSDFELAEKMLDTANRFLQRVALRIDMLLLHLREGSAGSDALLRIQQATFVPLWSMYSQLRRGEQLPSIRDELQNKFQEAACRVILEFVAFSKPEVQMGDARDRREFEIVFNAAFQFAYEFGYVFNDWCEQFRILQMITDGLCVKFDQVDATVQGDSYSALMARLQLMRDISTVTHHLGHYADDEYPAAVSVLYGQEVFYRRRHIQVSQVSLLTIYQLLNFNKTALELGRFFFRLGPSVFRFCATHTRGQIESVLLASGWVLVDQEVAVPAGRSPYPQHVLIHPNGRMIVRLKLDCPNKIRADGTPWPSCQFTVGFLQHNVWNGVVMIKGVQHPDPDINLVWDERNELFKISIVHSAAQMWQDLFLIPSRMNRPLHWSEGPQPQLMDAAHDRFLLVSQCARCKRGEMHLHRFL
jgi:hypothetical protein